MINEKDLLILYKKKKRQKLILISFIIFLVLICSVFGTMYFYQDHIYEYFSKVEIKLNTNDYTYKDNCFEIGASQCNDLNINNLIKSYNSFYKKNIGNDKATKTALDGIKNSKVGSYEVTFIFSNSYHNIDEKIKIKIIDDISPVLQLSVQSIEININDTIDYQSYITTVSDNNDNLTIEDVIYSEINTSISGNQVINYTLQDSAGNETSKDIQVTIKQPITTENSISTQKKNEITSDESKKNNTSNAENTSSPKNKYFSGYSIDIYNEALKYAENNSIRGYEIMPDGNGFQVTFY